MDIVHLSEPRGNPVLGALTGRFPVNICYADLRGEHGLDHATYYFDPNFL
jgi:hypothetical protein